jgi:hypothetical protein
MSIFSAHWEDDSLPVIETLSQRKRFQKEECLVNDFADLTRPRREIEQKIQIIRRHCDSKGVLFKTTDPSADFLISYFVSE